MDALKLGILPLTLLGIVLLLYWPALDNYFICDDFDWLKMARHIQTGGGWEEGTTTRMEGGWSRLWRGYRTLSDSPAPETIVRLARRSPLPMAVMTLTYQFSGLNPLGYHLLSLSLQGLNAILVMYLAWRLSRRWNLAFLAGFMFALHYVHRDTAIWLSSLPEVLAATFALGTLGFLMAYPQSSPIRSLVVTGLCLAAMASKPYAVVTLPIVLVWDFVSLRQAEPVQTLSRTLWEMVRRHWFLLLAGGWLTVALLGLRSVYTTFQPGPHILINLGRLGLSAFGGDAWPRFFSPSTICLLSGALFLGAGGLAWKGSWPVRFCVIWWVLSLAPTAPLQAEGFPPSRYAYFPSAPACILLAWLLIRAWEASHSLEWPWVGRATVVAAGGMLVLGHILLIRIIQQTYFEPASQTIRQMLVTMKSAHPDLPNGTQVYVVQGDWDEPYWGWQGLPLLYGNRISCTALRRPAEIPRPPRGATAVAFEIVRSPTGAEVQERPEWVTPESPKPAREEEG